MNTKGIKRGLIGVTLTMIIVASILVVSALTATADDITPQGALLLSKLADKAEYELGETIHYDLEVCNPNLESGATIDIFDQYAYDAEIKIADNVYLAPAGESGDCWTGTFNAVVKAGDADSEGWIINMLRVEGEETEEPYEPVTGSIGESVYTPPPDDDNDVPLLTPIGLIALVGLLTLIATTTIMRRKKR